MSIQLIDLGTGPNAGDGDPIRTCFGIHNDNVTELDARTDQSQTVIASASTTNIGSANNNFISVSGTTTITSFGTVANQAKFVTFQGVLTITYDATTLITPSGGNIKTAAGDAMFAVSDGSGNWTVVAYWPKATTPRKNWLSNSNFDVWQENTTYTPASATAVFLADFWRGRRGTSSSATFSRQAGFDGAQYCMRVARDSGNSDTTIVVISQQIASADVYELAGKTVRMSATVRAGADFSGSTVSASIVTGTGVDESFSLSSNSFTTGSVATSVGGQTITTSAARIVFTSLAIPSNTTELAVRFGFTPSGTAGAADYIEITNIKLEVGPTATPYEPELFNETLRRCQRRYRKSFLLATVPAQNVGTGTGELRAGSTVAGANAGIFDHVLFEAPMASTPTVTLYNPAAANAQVRNITDGADCSSSAAANITTTGFDITFTGTAGTAVGETLGVHFTADARL